MKEDWEDIIYENAVYKISTSKQKLKQKEYLKSGTIPIVDQGQDLIGGYTNDENRIVECDLPVLVFGDHTKITKLIDFKFAPGADGTKILEPSKFVLPEYLSIFTKVLTLKIKDNGYARHYQHIEKEFLPLAPLPVQRSIISKTEELFSDLDNGIANFKKAQEQLKIYRQAVLKKAFEGELTNSSHKDWEYLTLKECVKFSQGIQVDVNLQSENKFKNSVRFLRIIDFTQGNDPARYIDNPCEKYIVLKDDVSLVRYGASTGFVCSNLEGAIANNLFRVIPTKDIEKKYLFYFLSSPLFQNIISQSVKGAAMPAISFGLINDVLFPFPKDMAEQTQVVQEIESRLSVCDKMEQSINESIEKAEALRQSILKKAFEGKLLSSAEIELCKQAADYEPASELLKKIQAEKLAKEQEKKKKPTAKKKSKK